jgi:hypothetical protein
MDTLVSFETRFQKSSATVIHPFVVKKSMASLKLQAEQKVWEQKELCKVVKLGGENLFAKFVDKHFFVMTMHRFFLFVLLLMNT